MKFGVGEAAPLDFDGRLAEERIDHQLHVEARGGERRFDSDSFPKTVAEPPEERHAAQAVHFDGQLAQVRAHPLGASGDHVAVPAFEMDTELKDADSAIVSAQLQVAREEPRVAAKLNASRYGAVVNRRIVRDE